MNYLVIYLHKLSSDDDDDCDNLYSAVQYKT